MTIPGMQIADDFEKAFQACLSALTNPDHGNVRDSDELRTTVDLTIQRFLDVSKQMDCFFLQKRLLLSVQKPEHLLVENIQELNNELCRKEQLLSKYNKKIEVWQNLLQEIPGPRPAPPQQQQQQVVPQMAQNHPQMPPPQPQMPPQGHPHPHMAPHPQQVVQMQQQGMVMQPQQMHPQQQLQMAAQQQQGPGGLQGPLAYLERTMSNIGMPEPGR